MNEKVTAEGAVRDAAEMQNSAERFAAELRDLRRSADDPTLAALRIGGRFWKAAAFEVEGTMARNKRVLHSLLREHRLAEGWEAREQAALDGDYIGLISSALIDNQTLTRVNDYVGENCGADYRMF